MSTWLYLAPVVFAVLVAGCQPREKSLSPATAETGGGQGTAPTERGQYAEVSGLKMYYEVHGTGRPLVLLHGAFGWANVYPAVAKDRRVIAVELQGHGHTADVDRPLTFESMADDVAALLEHLKLEQCDIFGYSMGGTVAVGVAIRHPNLVRKVATFGSIFGPIDEGYSPETARQFKGLPADFAPPPIKGAYDRMAPDPKHWPVLVAKVKKLGQDFKGFSREDMKSIKAQVLLTLGDRDGLRLEHAAEMFRLIPNAQLAIFPGADHFAIMQSPDKILPTIAAFLNDR